MRYVLDTDVKFRGRDKFVRELDAYIDFRETLDQNTSRSKNGGKTGSKTGGKKILDTTSENKTLDTTDESKKAHE
ncbi:hypothetical protein GNI_217100, partial [Gregarina niphandrodes]